MGTAWSVSNDQTLEVLALAEHDQRSSGALLSFKRNRLIIGNLTFLHFGGLVKPEFKL